MAKKIIFFNHKGGVSKTTTAYNLGWMLADLGHRVMLVDADPQCNLTALMFADSNAFENYYFENSTKFNNIKDGVKAAFEGKPEPIRAINCIRATGNDNLFLIAGHADLSEYDASLSFAQTSSGTLYSLQNLPGAFNELIRLTSSKYDIEYVLIDLNPGLSAINQNLFSLSDYFLIPTNPDPFSVMAINTLSNVLPRWTSWMEQMRPIFENASYPLAETTPKMLGFIVQRFNIRKGIAARPFRNNIEEVQNIVLNKLVPALRKKNMLLEAQAYADVNIDTDYSIAEIPDFQSLVQRSQIAGVPVFALTDTQLDATGIVLDNMKESRETFKNIFSNIAKKVVSLCNYESSVHAV